MADSSVVRQKKGRVDDNMSKKQTTQTPAEKSTVTLTLPKWLFWCGIVVGVVGVVVKFTVLIGVYPSEEQIDMIGPDGVYLFQLYDRDGDGYLSLDEFEPLVPRLIETNETLQYDMKIDDMEEVVMVDTYYEQMKLETMTKDPSEAIIGGMDSLVGLKSWINAVLDWKIFGASHFSVFLPPSSDLMEMPGAVYDIIKVGFGLSNQPYSSNRYHPPRIDKKMAMIHRLLNMMHPRPFIISRFIPQGTTATIRAFNEEYIDIAFRIHAEFQLNEPPHHPFWFTPGQFTGHIIMSRNASKIVYFKMFVPNNRRLNVDMEWLNGPNERENMEVDIGYIALMELNISASSIANDLPSEARDITRLSKDEKLLDKVNKLVWTKEITMEEAYVNLEKHMYPFKEVPYYNFTESIQRAARERKLVHSILLWGALDDQSC